MCLTYESIKEHSETRVITVRLEKPPEEEIPWVLVALTSGSLFFFIALLKRR